MANSDQEPPTEEKIKQSFASRLQGWGESSLAPSILATLIFPLHWSLRPRPILPNLFPPILLFTSYVNLAGFKRDAAGLSSAWSGMYLLLAWRRPQPFMKRWGTRGIVRGAAMGLAAVNLAAGGWAYMVGERGRKNHWIGKED